MGSTRTNYRDYSDEVTYSINYEKFKSLSHPAKLHVVQNLYRVVSQNSFPIRSNLRSDSVVKESSPLGGYSTQRPFNGPEWNWLADSQLVPKPNESAINIDLGYQLPDFRYSSDCRSVPEYYRVPVPVPNTTGPLTSPRVYAYSANPPFNLLIGNLAIFKQNTNSSSTSAFSAHSPSQSFFTYFYGSSAVDKYCQFSSRSGYPL